ncbi:MAG TPA: DsbA family oxidoreductase [Ktedonobacterales bacterium]|nr:DsbA family oxidoreductase [Ktedonobacterales bacterium]
MNVEIWSDVVCPWCYIGKRRLEQALAQFSQRNAVNIRWRSFELDPDAPERVEGTLDERLAQKYRTTKQQAAQMNARVSGIAAADGLDYHLDQAKPSNTFNAHRLLHLALKRGVQGDLKERLLRAYFTEGQPIGDCDTLVRLATEAGLDADEARATLAGDDYAEDVRADEERAASFGITGVPFVVIDERYGVSGAQPTEVFLNALQTAWAASQPLTIVGADAEGDSDTGACEGDSCAI